MLILSNKKIIYRNEEYFGKDPDHLDTLRQGLKKFNAKNRNERKGKSLSYVLK